MAHKQLVSVALAFALGAAAASVLGAVRSARADGQAPQRGYFCFQASDAMDLQTKANAAAQRGWRMVSGVGHPGSSLWCFESR